MTAKMAMTNHSSSYRRVRGFTLIEALIALLILSIGLLGVAGMQLKALQSAHIAYQRSLASAIAIDAQERLWSKLEPGESCPPVSDVITAWKKAWFTNGGDGRETLPVGEESSIEEDSCDYTVVIDWDEERTKNTEDSSLIYKFTLPELS